MSCLYVSVVLLLGCSYVAAVHPPVIGTIFREKQLETMAHIACSRIPSKQVSDACTGCIWRLSNDAKKPETEGPVADCSTYFKSTMFQNCSDALADKISSRNDGLETPFCEFDECIRRADNKHTLNVCTEKAAKETKNQAEIVTKTITCLFCRAHCLDQKFLVVKDAGPRYPFLTATEDYDLMATVMTYGVTNEKVCTVEYEQPPPVTIPNCDCSNV